MAAGRVARPEPAAPKWQLRDRRRPASAKLVLSAPPQEACRLSSAFYPPSPAGGGGWGGGV